MSRNLQLVDECKIVVGLSPILPSTSTPDYVSLKGYARCTVMITANNATTVTGSAISLLQATSVAAGGAKALEFDWVYANADISASDTLVRTAVTSDTFTPVATNNLDSLYIIEIEADDLDVANGFDCIRAVTADATAQVIAVHYILHGARYASPIAISAITD